MKNLNKGINCGICHPGDLVEIVLSDGTQMEYEVIVGGVHSISAKVQKCWVNGKLRVNLLDGWEFHE